MKYQLNPEQESAVLTNEQKVLCLAGAGTGKTQTMISRIVRLVNEGVAPASILALTFTNAASAEMRARYSAIQTNHDEGNVPQFRTFHSFCYSLICSDTSVRTELGYVDTPDIANEDVIKKIKAESKARVGLKLSESQLKEPHKLTGYALQMYNIFMKDYYKRLRQRNLITFDILCNDVCKLFEENKHCIQIYKKRYQYIFVDEFQDTDPIQYRFISSFDNSNLFVVGDALQAIYQFRGADSSIIKQLANSPEWHTVKLNRNYRSSKNICDFANDNSTYADNSYRIPLVSEKDGPKVVTESNFNIPANVSDIIAKLPSLEGSVAILCKTNKTVDEISDLLFDAGVMFSRKTESFDTVSAIQSVLDKSYYLEWLCGSLNSNDMANWIKLNYVSDDIGYVVSKFLLLNGESPDVKRKVDVVERYRKEIIDKDLLDSPLAEVLEKLDINPLVVDNNNTIKSNIYVGTIHSAKGLEYDSVFLPDVGDFSFKLNCEANCNCYYVGITRAKHNLFVYRW